MARRLLAESAGMSDEGARIAERRARLGWTQDELATAAGVHRDTVGAIEGGAGFQAGTLIKINNALDEGEAEAGTNVPAVEEEGSGQLEVEVISRGGLRVAARGPIGEPDALMEVVARLVHMLRDDAAE